MDTIKELQNKVKEAVSMFIDKDGDLLALWGHEQAISHRIAVYLEYLFRDSGLNIDCEYNKHIRDNKKVSIHLDINECRLCRCDTCKKIIERGLDVLDEKPFRPDILVHNRGNDGNNKIVIEIKKDKDCPFDAAKLRALTLKKERTGEYGYNLGASILFVKGNEPQYRWFVDGEETVL